MSVLLEVSGLTRIHGRGCPRCFIETGPDHGTNRCPACGSVVALNRVSLTLNRGEVVGVIGESGSGKSTLVRLLCFDEPPTAGRAVFHDGDRKVDLFALDAARQRAFRDTHLGVVYQNPMLGLDLSISAGGNIAERLIASEKVRYVFLRNRASELLARTGVPATRMDEPPKRFSGGMQQRVQIAKALATEPPLLLLDEITTGLDLSVQARILDLVLELQEQLEISMLVVTHDLGVVRHLASRTLVMRYGAVVEAGLTDQILEDPRHPYTQELVSAAL